MLNIYIYFTLLIYFSRVLTRPDLAIALHHQTHKYDLMYYYISIIIYRILLSLQLLDNKIFNIILFEYMYIKLLFIVI